MKEKLRPDPRSSQTMRAMEMSATVCLDQTCAPLRLVRLPIPQPQAGELLIRVSACGVCHTELDEIEGRMTPPQLPVVLGHEVVGRVAQLGRGAGQFQIGDRVGVGWIHRSSGTRTENLSPSFCATGRDVPGGYAEWMTVPENYACSIPDCFSDTEAAPLLCAGAVGFRALKLARLQDGDRLGFTGFGASAHLVLQVAQHLMPRSQFYVFARDRGQQEFARQLGAHWAGHTMDHAPEKMHAIIDTTPAWQPVVQALSNLLPGGRLVINAIRKEVGDRHALAAIDYQEHLWMEKEIKTVANITHYDIAEFLPIAAEIPIKSEIVEFELEQANEALMRLHRGGARGAMVLKIGENVS